MCPTTLSSLTTSFQANYTGNTPQTAMELDTLSIDWSSTSPGWNGFSLDTPWFYDGIGNLIIEFRYLGSTGTTRQVP